MRTMRYVYPTQLMASLTLATVPSAISALRESMIPVTNLSYALKNVKMPQR